MGKFASSDSADSGTDRDVTGFLVIFGQLALLEALEKDVMRQLKAPAQNDTDDGEERVDMPKMQGLLMATPTQIRMTLQYSTCSSKLCSRNGARRLWSD